MRILAIRGRNLASLARTFAVELARGELANAGLFAITGPVGAGKSTLLDALCLALFDRTPRLTGRGGTLIGDDGQERGDWLRANDPRTLLRRNAVDGHAEVDFVGRDGVPYRARWSVRRARRKPDGRLQEQELVLEDLAKGQVIASGRRTEVLAAIRHRLGLDFGQFCRSVLLAQGEFHAFLHAAADERAKLLETLTGAQLYRRLSRRAHEKKREHDKIVSVLRARFDQCEVLADELRTALEQDGKKLAAQLEVCDVGIKIAQEYVLWHKAAEAHREEEDKATLALNNASVANKAADGRRQQLQASQRAMAAVPRWEVVLQGRGKAQDMAAHVAKVRQASVDARHVVDAAQKQLAALLKPHFGELSVMPHVVRDLPQWRGALERWHATEQRQRSEEEQVGKLGKAAAQAEQRCQDLRKDGVRLEKTVAQAEAAVQLADKAVSEADYDQVTARRRELAKQQTDLRQEAEALRAWQVAQGVEKAARTAHDKVVAEANTVQPQRGVSALELQATVKALGKARENLHAAEQQHGLTALRAKLVEGQECPLCGATEHPAEAHDVADLDTLREAVAKREASHAAAQRQAEQAGLDWQRRQGDVARRQEDLQAAEAALAKATAAREVASEQPVADLDLRHQQWQVADSELQAVEADASRRSQALREARAARSDAEQARSASRQQLDRTEQEHRIGAEALGSARAMVARTGDVLHEIRQGLAPACDGLPDGVQAIAGLSEHRLSALDAMHESDRAKAAADARLASAGELVQTALASDQTARTELESFEQAFVTALTINEVCEHDVAVAHRLGADALRDESVQLQALLDEVVRCRTELSLRARLRREHEDHDRPTLDSTEALLALGDAQKDRARIEKMRLEVHGKAMLDDSVRRRREQLQPDLDRASREFDTWRALNDLIGSSGGDAFAVFAQGLTLDLLLLEANRRLEELARRYRLEKSKGGELDFVVVDLDMGGTRRSLHTLSGGETFLVSLALALALATLAAPRSRVETLFLDEGFGTLDAQNLEIALGALDSLQATGCQVGVISHVEGIAERIGAVVEVRPEGSGRSRVLASGS